MQSMVVALALLIQGGAPAAADLDTYSLCVAEGAAPGGSARYVSDPFETGLDEMDARAFHEYVEQAYLHRRDSDYRTACTSYPSRAAADQALAKAVSPVAGLRIVSTKWRASFE